jgi:hypothetical protein
MLLYFIQPCGIYRRETKREKEEKKVTIEEDIDAQGRLVDHQNVRATPKNGQQRSPTNLFIQSD